jgi:hypothetical protein
MSTSISFDGMGVQGILCFVIAGLDPAIQLAFEDLTRKMDARVIGERSDAVLRTAMPAHDE